MMTEPVPYECFMSYARTDNDDFDHVVDRLKKELAGRFEAATGSKLKIFLDRESIGWGEQWRDKIADAINGSTLFIPIVTMRYFNRPQCRDEFSAFHAAAIQRGVPDLILPIVLAGAEYITTDHADELVCAVEKLNCQPICEEFEAGYESPAWKRRIGQLVSELQSALTKAADRLTVGAPAATHLAPSSNDPMMTDVDEQSIMNLMEELASDMGSIGPMFESFSGLVADRMEGRDPTAMTTGQRAFLFGAMANDLSQPAIAFGEKASNIEACSRQVDAQLRAMVAELYDIDPERAERELVAVRSAIGGSLTVLEEFTAQTAELEKSLRIAALSNVNLRRALAPITAGLRSLSTAAKVISSWQELSMS
jgi:hypothetical protein